MFLTHEGLQQYLKYLIFQWQLGMWKIVSVVCFLFRVRVLQNDDSVKLHNFPRVFHGQPTLPTSCVESPD